MKIQFENYLCVGKTSQVFRNKLNDFKLQNIFQSKFRCIIESTNEDRESQLQSDFKIKEKRKIATIHKVK